MGTGRRFAIALTLAAAAAIFAASVPAHGAIERPHALAFKLGYHVYPNSSYFDLSEEAGVGSTQDLSGQSLELFDYTYQWTSRWSLSASLFGGYYQEVVFSQTQQQSMFVHTMTVTPLYRLAGSEAIGAWQVYTGAGLGRYGFNVRFDFATGSPIEIHTYTLGYHALIGAEYRYNEQTGFLIEGKFSRARIRFSTDEFGGLEIDVGGLNISAGFRIHF